MKKKNEKQKSRIQFILRENETLKESLADKCQTIVQLNATLDLLRMVTIEHISALLNKSSGFYLFKGTIGSQERSRIAFNHV